ncbi:MAG: hypothetical protein H7Y12_14955 [Sphingobacteriaceae bacterium]|nr:hypothetical protein [Cytophagaceae bacterium]
MKTNDDLTLLKSQLHELIEQVEDVQALQATLLLLSKIQKYEAFLGSYSFFEGRA